MLYFCAKVKHMQQTQSTLSSKYQIVVPAKVRQALRVSAGDTLVWHVVHTRDQKKVIAQVKPKNWTKHTRGLGKAIWKDVPIDQYIKNLRDEWSQQT